MQCFLRSITRVILFDVSANRLLPLWMHKRILPLKFMIVLSQNLPRPVGETLLPGHGNRTVVTSLREHFRSKLTYIKLTNFIESEEEASLIQQRPLICTPHSVWKWCSQLKLQQLHSLQERWSLRLYKCTYWTGIAYREDAQTPDCR